MRIFPLKKREIAIRAVKHYAEIPTGISAVDVEPVRACRAFRLYVQNYFWYPINQCFPYLPQPTKQIKKHLQNLAKCYKIIMYESVS